MERFDAVHAVALVRNRIVAWVNLRGRAQRHLLLVEKICNQAAGRLDECPRADRRVLLSSPFHKFGHVYLDLEARWTIGNFGHGMPCPYISRHPIDL